MCVLTLDVHALDDGHDDVRVAVAGELDLATSDQLERALLPVIASAPKRIVLDFGDLTFCDSSGTRTIISLHREAARLGTQVVIAAAGAEVRRTFEIVQLGSLLELVEE
jgi:anti-sigma B factor antagonist